MKAKHTPEVNKIPLPKHVLRRNYFIWKHGEDLSNIAEENLPKQVVLYRSRCTNKSKQLVVEGFKILGKSPIVEDLKKTL